MNFKFTFLIFFILLALKGFGQHDAIPFQGAARDGLGNILNNRNISLQFSIIDSSISGPIIYTETHSTTTSNLGLFTVNVGQGSASVGVFDQIDWRNNDKYLSVALDTNNGSSFVQMGITQMLSVPYALYAKSAGTKIGFRANIIPETIAVGSNVPLRFGTIDYNDGNGVDSTGFTAPESGLYNFTVSIFWNPISTCTRVTTYLVKGVTSVDSQQAYFCDNVALNSYFNSQQYLQAGETIKVRIFHNHTAGASIATGLTNVFSGYKIY